MQSSLRLAATLLFTIATALTSGTLFAAAGDADPLFGGAGYVRYGAPRIVPALFSAALALDDGSTIVAGGADTEVFVRHYRADGSLDERFGVRGTTIIPDFAVQSRVPPALQLFRDASGRILVEQHGRIRRLSENGSLDTLYQPKPLNVDGRPGYYNLLPQPDGRFVVVTGQQASTETFRISVRYYLPDGTPDTLHGGETGERLLYPGGEGQYTDAATSAVTDAAGRILIAARWDRNATDTSLVLIRLNPDGSYDASFGQGGVVLIGSKIGIKTLPQVSVGRDGRIAYYFNVQSYGDPSPYFVIYVLTNSGQIDASAPSGGRISVVYPTDATPLGLVSPSPELTVIGLRTTTGTTNAVQVMTWRGNVATGAMTGPAFSQPVSASSDFSFRQASIAGGSIWVVGAEDRFVYGFVGAGPLEGYGRGVLARIDANATATSTPQRIVASVNERQSEAFDAIKPLSDGSLLVLGRYLPERQQYPGPTLTKFTADGRIDPSYGTNGRVQFATGDGGKNAVLRSSGDTPTILRSVTSCGLRLCSYSASLWRFTTTGTPDTGYGVSGTVVVASNVAAGNLVVPGFVDASGRAHVAQLVPATTLVQPYTVMPMRYTVAGASDAAFQSTPQPLIGAPPRPTDLRLDALPDGRLQALVVRGDNQRLRLQVLRWLADGGADPSLPVTAFTIATVDPGSDAHDLDTRVLADGRTLVAIDQGSQRIVLRLRADGTLDPTFGTNGSARIDGVVSVYRSKLAIDRDGSILLAYNTRLGATGSALTVARLTADGQRDPTFTADGRFDSLFSLNARETASDVIVLPDGHIVAAGQSESSSNAFVWSTEGHGILLMLRGRASRPAIASAPVVEFYNRVLDHYFVTAGPGEIVGIDKGGAGPGWERTGLGFRGFVPESGVPTNAVPVCRFYGTPGRGPNSHFYTSSAAECAQVKRDPGWTYEGIAFHVLAPQNDQCIGSNPVYRAYNNGFLRNDSNHRYSTELSLLQSMTSQGWSVEGVAFCGVP